MGKIKVATLGSEQEEKLREKRRIQREEKKKREHAEKVHISGMKGGERIKSVGAESEEEMDKLAHLAEEVEAHEKGEGQKGEEKKEEKKKKIRIRHRGKKYKEAVMKVEKDKPYPIDDALKLLRTIALASFDETVELHINTTEKGLRGTTKLPHGTGKEVRVKIADGESIDAVIKSVETGKIDFDVLVAHPSVMSKLAKVARFLGPKGLMPNPKNGTISQNPQEVAKKLAGGEINWKTESEFPIIHQRIGKLSFKDGELTENIAAFIKSVGIIKIKNITLKSTMSPGIKLQISA